MLNVRMLMLSLAMLCAACASNSPIAEVSTQTVTANIATPVACIDAAKVPKVPMPTVIDLASAGVDQKVAALAADAIAAREAVTTARALLLQCSQPPEGVKP